MAEKKKSKITAIIGKVPKRASQLFRTDALTFVFDRKAPIFVRSKAFVVMVFPPRCFLY